MKGGSMKKLMKFNRRLVLLLIAGLFLICQYNQLTASADLQDFLLKRTPVGVVTKLFRHTENKETQTTQQTKTQNGQQTEIKSTQETKTQSTQQIEKPNNVNSPGQTTPSQQGNTPSLKKGSQ